MSESDYATDFERARINARWHVDYTRRPARTFADILNAEMTARGMQTKELAALVGVSCVTIQMWRNGRWNLKVRHALKLARLFGMTVEQLFHDIP